MVKSLLNSVQQALIPAALIFAAGFAYQSNARLAVIDAKLDAGLAAIKECRAMTDANSLAIVALQEREKFRRGL